MDARDLFLQQHTVVHSAAVGGNKMSAVERNLAGLSDAQMRVPRAKTSTRSRGSSGTSERDR